MPSTDDERGGQRRRRDAAADRAEFRRQHDDDADEAERQAEPMARQDLLAEQPAGEDGGDQRLQPDDQRRNAGRHAAWIAQNTPPR